MPEAPTPRMMTAADRLLEYLQNDRRGKETSWKTICRHFSLLRDLQGVLQGLVAAGKVKKLKKGYKANVGPKE